MKESYSSFHRLKDLPAANQLTRRGTGNLSGGAILARDRPKMDQDGAQELQITKTMTSEKH